MTFTDTLLDPPTVEENLEEIDISPDAMVAFAQRERLRLLRQNGLSEKLQLEVLNSISSSALASKKLIQDNNNALADREVASALADGISKIQANPFLLPTVVLPDRHMIIKNRPDIPLVTPVDGETVTEVLNLEFTDLKAS